MYKKKELTLNIIEMNLNFKTNRITDDYEICEKSLGYGNNCRILLCINKLNGIQCALKVS